MTEFTKWRSLVDGAEISAIPDGLVDNFNSVDDNPVGPYEEDFDLSNFYTGAVDEFQRSNEQSFSGQTSLAIPSTDDDTVIHSEQGDGLPNYPSPGDTFSSFWYFGSETSWGDVSVGLSYGIPTDNIGTADAGYLMFINDGPQLELRKDGVTQDSDGGMSQIEAEFFEIEIQYGDSVVDHEATVFILDNDGNRDSTDASVSFSDAEHENNSFGLQENHDSAIDNYLDNIIIG